MYYEIHWLCTLTGTSGIQDFKYSDYELPQLLVGLYNDYYGKLFKHSIIYKP
jgi:hypothetical protein